MFVFSGLKTHAQLLQASKLLFDADNNLKSYETFERDTLSLNKKYNTTYLRAEYEYATGTIAQVERWESFSDDEERYLLQYRTASDDKVRVSHAELHNITLPKSHNFWKKYTPKNGWGCRCTVVEVLARKNKVSNSKEALKKGAKATTLIGKNGKNKLEIFRYNSAIEEVIFPKNHPYQKVVGATKALQEIEKAARKQIETWDVIPTKKGYLEISSKHGSNERIENIEIASYFTDKYGHHIRLIGRSNIEKRADAFNETLGVNREYKRNITPTRNAIDREIRDAKNQAEHIVLDIKSGINDDDLKRAINGRVKRSKTIKTITIIRNDNDITYTREDILKWRIESKKERTNKSLSFLEGVG